MEIKINTETPLSDQEREVLRVLLGEAVPSVAASAPAAAQDPEDSSDEEEEVKPRRRAAKKASAPRKKAEPEPEPEEDEDEEPEEDEDGDEEESLFDRAVAAATELAGSGKAAVVRKALTKVKAKKVSDIKSDKDLQKFLDEIGA